MSQAKVGAIMRNLALLTALVLFISGPVPVRGQSNDEPEIDLSSIEKAAVEINNAKRPLILFGQGVILANAEKEFKKLELDIKKIEIQKKEIQNNFLLWLNSNKEESLKLIEKFIERSFLRKSYCFDSFEYGFSEEIVTKCTFSKSNE